MEKSKIQKFVEGLMNSELTDSQQSVVLSTDEALIGAATNPGCRNSVPKACNGENEGCINYGDSCENGTNPECTNKPVPGGITSGGSTIGSAEKP